MAEAELRYVFELADADGSGTLSMTEVGTVLRGLGLLCRGGHPGATAVGTAPPPTGIEAWVRPGMESAGQLLHGGRLLFRQTALAWRLISGTNRTAPLSNQDQSLVDEAMRDLMALVPFLFVNLFIPGASVLSVLMVKYCPALVPTAFLNAQRARDASGLPNGTTVEEFDRLCLRTFGSFVREASRVQAIGQADKLLVTGKQVKGQTDGQARSLSDVEKAD
eukprot:gnl/TRDRNA2_/TRDRNA2_159046_c1_seq1.p1 gnl/TRDRNA2_/TRDRNA2_159046_c1~~gnl/TRDRNA2_/TRDRNA2_159046_c1_seq1.p1  ORF type:complete len:260 (+),score=40.91 gnl/TRDRNA2_/TRDRNA2_159046_c1_seq1:119-781(+)